MRTPVKYFIVEVDNDFNRTDMRIALNRSPLKYFPAVVGGENVEIACRQKQDKCGYLICFVAPLSLCIGKILRYVTVQDKSLLEYCNTSGEK